MGLSLHLALGSTEEHQQENTVKRIAVVILAAAALAGCSSTAPAAPATPTAAQTVPATTPTPTPPPPAPPATKPKPSATVDPVAQAITDRYGDCLVSLGFTKPFTIDVYALTHKAVVSGPPGAITFNTGTANTGSLITIPVDTDSSARALASVGC